MREEKKKDNTNEKKGVSFEALSSLDAPVSFWKGIPFGLQHVMAMFVANLAPIFLVASAANMSAEQSATIIQAGLLVAGLGTCLQLYGVWLIGSRLPMVTGISFTYVAAAMSIAQNQGYGAVAGAVVLGGLLEVALGLTAKYWRRFVPPIVSAIVVTSIGFSLLSVGATSFGGGSGAEDFGSWQNLTLGLISLVACLAFQLLMKVRIISVIQAGRIIGRTILKKEYFSPAPSIRAASSTSSGMAEMNWPIRNTPKEVLISGRISAQKVSSMPVFAISMYWGSAVTSGRNRMANTMTRLMMVLPGNRSLAMA